MAGKQSEALLDDGDQNVDRDGNPDLRFDGIFGGAEECPYQTAGARRCDQFHHFIAAGAWDADAA